jgi:hypothetical protein
VKDPEHPVGPAFEQAIDRIEHWRKQQEAALTPGQAATYSRIATQQQEKRHQHEADFRGREEDLVNEEKRRLLLHKPEPALRMQRGRPMPEQQAERLARSKVQQRHQQERAALEQEQQRERDYFLQLAERARALGIDAAPPNRDDGRDPPRGRSRDDGRGR